MSPTPSLAKALDEPRVTPEAAASHGMNEEEYERLRSALGREPTWTELGVTSALWSEHCSYKSSKVYLRELPTEGPHVVQGPGENAGIVDLGNGWVAAFKMESHNHPSYIEPYQGAATGVGGILRDVFTMGARPVAVMDSLFFGAIDAPRMRYLIDGVVRGVGDYVVLYPKAPIVSFNTFPLLWFVLGLFPVVPAWLIAAMFFVTNLSGLFGPPASVAFAAHLGGFAAGLLLIRPWMEKRRADMAPWKGWESQASRRNPRMRRRD
jgi:hypothetical protein